MSRYRYSLPSEDAMFAGDLVTCRSSNDEAGLFAQADSISNRLPKEILFVLQVTSRHLGCIHYEPSKL